MFWRKKDKHSSQTILRCSFCNKSQHDVRKMVAGPKVQICDECVEICVSVLSDQPAPDGESRTIPIVPDREKPN